MYKFKNVARSHIIVVICLLFFLALSITHDINQSKLTKQTKQECLKKTTTAVEFYFCTEGSK
jgi:hypothetical protein